MNNSQFAKDHLSPTIEGDRITVTCNCGRKDIVNTRTFIENNCTHRCSADHTEDSWFSQTVQIEPYNAYWRILQHSGSVARRTTLEQRYKLVMQQITAAETLRDLKCE